MDGTWEQQGWYRSSKNSNAASSAVIRIIHQQPSHKPDSICRCCRTRRESMLDSQTAISRLALLNAVTMSPKDTQTSETKLPFEVDAAVLEKVAEFRSQQQASLELAGPGDGGDGNGQTQIDF